MNYYSEHNNGELYLDTYKFNTWATEGQGVTLLTNINAPVTPNRWV